MRSDFTAAGVALELNTMAFAKSFYQASPVERVRFIRNGVPASLIPDLAVAMHVSRQCLLGMLHLPSAAIGRKIRQGATLSTEQSERVIGLVHLIGQVAVMVENSGDPTGFDAAQWIGEWLEQPIPALGGAAPAGLMDTLTGQAFVANLLGQSQAGVFA